jgi:hypothetical protein
VLLLLRDRSSPVDSRRGTADGRAAVRM